MTKIPISSLKPGDVILPPARELRLWMRRECARRALPESALHLTVVSVSEGQPDSRGAWSIVTCRETPEWGAKRTASFPFVFRARPCSAWPLIRVEGGGRS